MLPNGPPCPGPASGHGGPWAGHYPNRGSGPAPTPRADAGHGDGTGPSHAPCRICSLPAAPGRPRYTAGAAVSPGAKWSDSVGMRCSSIFDGRSARLATFNFRYTRVRCCSTVLMVTWMRRLISRLL